MADLRIPDLTFPTLASGTHQSTRDLRALLYLGGAATPAFKVARFNACDQLGLPLAHRLPLVKQLHAAISGEIAKGKSRNTIENTIIATRRFAAWCDTDGRALTLASVAQDYRAWTESLLYRVRVRKDLKLGTAYHEANSVDRVLAKALGIQRGLRRLTRLKAPKFNDRTLGKQADKQNLAQTFAYGHVLLDITDAISLEAIRGPLPLTIHLRGGGYLTEWSGLRSPEKCKALQGIGLKTTIRDTVARRAAWEADATSRTRFPLVNLRIEAELLIFIAQTGMNLSQAHRLRRGNFRYQSEAEELLVYRVYKERRGGEAEFRVYKAYRPLFERYQAWLDAVVPRSEDIRLFPFIYPSQIPAIDSPPRFQAIRSRCSRLAMAWVGPQALRKTRVNWLLRRSRDPDLTAEMAQHTKEVLFASYEQPSHQVAAVEIMRFHRLTDPAIAPPGPGVCVEVHRSPRPIADASPEAPTPDCVSPAGCLFCDFHRDIDRDDYVWSLVTYRHLKALELARYAPPSKEAPKHPAVTVIDRINAKLKHLEVASEMRSSWVHEAHDRVREGRYHPAWDGFIQCMEISA